MITGALTLNTHNIAIIEEGTDWYSIEVLQVGMQAHRLGLHRSIRMVTYH